MLNELFFNITDGQRGIQRELAPGITASVYPGEQAMISVVRFAPFSEGKLHHHPEEQWGILIEGSAIRVQGDSETSVQKGDFRRTPPNVPHTIKAGPEGAVIIDVFSPPRDDYRSAGSGFGS